MEPDVPLALPDALRHVIDRLLPLGRPGYAAIRRRLETLSVLGVGRWGVGDLVLGAPGQSVDLDAPMEPVAALGGALLRGDAGTFDMTMSIHDPDDEGRIEIHVGGVPIDRCDVLRVESVWTLSDWSPGDPAPQTNETPREIALDDASTLTLAISAERRQVWLHDSVDGTNRLVPVTNFYNELMLELGERNPAIALDHRRLFSGTGTLDQSSIRAAFRRYNRSFRKVAPERLEPVDAHAPDARQSAWIARWFQRTGRNNGRSA